MEGNFQHSTSRKRWRVRRSFFFILAGGAGVVVEAGVDKGSSALGMGSNDDDNADDDDDDFSNDGIDEVVGLLLLLGDVGAAVDLLLLKLMGHD